MYSLNSLFLFSLEQVSMSLKPYSDGSLYDPIVTKLLLTSLLKNGYNVTLTEKRGSGKDRKGRERG